jgi:hypothetical protein
MNIPADQIQAFQDELAKIGAILQQGNGELQKAAQALVSASNILENDPAKPPPPQQSKSWGSQPRIKGRMEQ